MYSFFAIRRQPEGAAVLEHALAFSPRVTHLVVSCNQGGKMAELAQESKESFAFLLDDVVNDRGLAMTSSFTTMVIVAQALAHLWDGDHFEKTLETVTLAAEYLLEDGAVLAHRLSVTKERYSKACFVGAGGLSATSRESALKLSELTSGSIQTMYESTLGLRHGPMSSLSMDTLFTVFLSNGESRRRFDRDLLNEVRAKGVAGMIIGGAVKIPNATTV
jgi:tagatose-6-phosphate ketose/aldose isomerase